MKSYSIPVKLKDSFEGFAESKGLLSIAKDTLVIQFQTKDAILGMVKSDLKEVCIPINNVIELGYKKSLFGNKLSVKVDDLKILREFPESDNNELILSIARNDIDQAIDLVRSIKMDLSEKEYKQAINSLDDDN